MLAIFWGVCVCVLCWCMLALMCLSTYMENVVCQKNIYFWLISVFSLPFFFYYEL